MNTSTPRSSARAASKREQILNGAQRLFLAHGYSRTSTNAIARDAGISKETLYAYYPTKEVLFAAVVEHVADVLANDHFEEISQSMPTTREAFQQELLGLAQRILRNTMQPDYLALIRLVIAESTNVPQLASMFRSSLPLRGLAEMSNLLERARAGHLIQVENVEVAARMFIGSLLTYIVFDGLMLTTQAPRPPDPTWIAMSVTFFCQALFSETNQSQP